MTVSHLWDNYDPVRKDFLVRTFNDVRGRTVPLDLRWGQVMDVTISDVKDFEFVLGNYSYTAEREKGQMSQKESCFQACFILRERAGLPQIEP